MEPVQPGGRHVDRTRIIMDASRRATAITLNNDDKTAVLAQSLSDGR